MSPTIANISAKEVRSRYAFLFGTVSELYVMRNGGDRPSTSFEDVQKTTEALKEDGYLSDYLYESLKALYALYPTMLPGKEHEQAELRNLFELLGIAIGDVAAEIADYQAEAESHDREYLIKSLLG